MELRLLRSKNLRALAIVYVLIAAAFVFVVQAQAVSAQAQRTELVVGLQNDMTSMNYFDPATNPSGRRTWWTGGSNPSCPTTRASRAFPSWRILRMVEGPVTRSMTTGLNVTVQIR